jgi:hypothetical protein
LQVVPPAEGVDLVGAERAAASALLGTLREHPRSRAEFLALTTSAPSAAHGGRHG